MESLGSEKSEKQQLEKTLKKYESFNSFGVIWLILVIVITLASRYSAFSDIFVVSFNGINLFDMLPITGFVALGFAMFPTKGEREAWAKLAVLKLQDSGDSPRLLAEINSESQPVYQDITSNPTFRYWVPLYREFRRLGIDVPGPIEERFARLDRNRLNLFWAPVRRERAQHASQFPDKQTKSPEITPEA